MGIEDNKVDDDEQPLEKWIIDIDEKIFYRHLPRSNDFPLAYSRMVYDKLGNRNVEIHSANFELGPYRRVQDDDERPLEKWIIDIDEKIFHRDLPRSNDFPLAYPGVVNDKIGNNNVEIRSVNFTLGPYRRIQSD